MYAQADCWSTSLGATQDKELPEEGSQLLCASQQSLRGGGNKAQSYIVCMDCNTRWENLCPAAQLKKDLKENNKQQKGLLSQNVEDEVMEQAPEEDTKVVDLCRRLKEEKHKSQRMREDFDREIEAQRIASREMERKLEARIHAVVLENQERLRTSTAAAPTTAKAYAATPP